MADEPSKSGQRANHHAQEAAHREARGLIHERATPRLHCRLQATRRHTRIDRARAGRADRVRGLSATHHPADLSIGWSARATATRRPREVISASSSFWGKALPPWRAYRLRRHPRRRLGTKKTRSGYDGVDDVLATFNAIASGYRLNRQIGQPMFTLLACEAGGMIPQMERVAEPFGVPVLSGGGFDSVSVKHDLGREVARSARIVRLLHVGDYDPSGVHLFSSLDEDVRAFAYGFNHAARFEAVRVAILPEHVTAYGLQTAPKKATDNRSFEGVDGDADGTVQAEALDPADLAGLVETALRRDWDRASTPPIAPSKSGEADERERACRSGSNVRSRRVAHDPQSLAEKHKPGPQTQAGLQL